MTKKRIKKVDRISELSEPILHHILSFLSFKQVARTSVLSKKWERAWRAYPVLEFDFTVFKEYSFEYSGDRCIYRKLNKDELRRRNVLFNCLAETMRNRHCRDMISLKKFKLDLIISNDREFVSFVDQCICHAIGCNVKELKLIFTTGLVRWYNLPQILLCANSIEDLELKMCKLELPRNYVKLSSLRKLFLSEVYMDDHMIKNLVGGCPLIEYLHFLLCIGFKSLELFGLTRLNKIKLIHIDEVERLDINALNVRLLDIFRPAASCKINLAFCKNLTSLKLYGASIRDEWFDNQISKLSVLEFLSIAFGSKLKSVKISNPFLKELHISSCMNLVELNIDTPILNFLYYGGKMIFLSSNAMALSKICLKFRWHSVENIETRRYIEFLANFHHFSEVLDLEIAMSENVMVPRELRETISSPLSNLKLWNLSCGQSPTIFTIAKVVDDLLWFAPHTKTLSIKYGNVN